MTHQQKVRESKLFLVNKPLESEALLRKLLGFFLCFKPSSTGSARGNSDVIIYESALSHRDHESKFVFHLHDVTIIGF